MTMEVESTRSLSIETVRPKQQPMLLGLHQGWIEGLGDGVKFDLSCGAGVGNPYLQLRVELPDGTKVWEHADISEFVQAWVAAIREEHDA